MLSEEVVDLRSSSLTNVMLLLSAWWVKDLAAFVVAATVDLWRRRAPWSALLVAVATTLAAQAADLLKGAFDRPRPFSQHLWSALGSLPDSSSMPSGHAATAVAAATALSLVVPGARVTGYGLAALVCISRVYLGVHFISDVIVGALLGALVAIVVVGVGRRLLKGRLVGCISTTHQKPAAAHDVRNT